MQKSDAAQEAFLAELAKDQKNSGSKEAENLKQAREKSKDKKKTKEQKKFKDAKVSGNLVSCDCLKCTWWFYSLVVMVPFYVWARYSHYII